MYFKDAARAIVMLAEAPLPDIKMVNYLVAGPSPAASAQELADTVRAKVPGARVELRVDEQLQTVVDNLAARRLDDHVARQEWGWRHEYNQEHMVDDFLRELKVHPQRYT